ncbi:TOMM precursor leader peptide-binding protein [Spongiactinospora sp. TRM90649]|uniref:TOMM precursor leader peptide-binding protein n=1 Tax=Spongiactinospora sp. TRM90649 TaxID=3031114 RepID=UPI0023F8DAB0|nr:TOMM precursor leader peptide-binding protein [Spongiactinospora sp. TRM90649]MDF5757592.1 TOMM precursor leader peptide-binding protein [Spongiactinospora sp. TRM90649]
MAAAVRVADLAVAAIGDFGAEVARVLREEGATPLDPHRPILTGRRAAVLLSWRPEPDACEALDRACFAAGVPWLPVTIEHPYLVAGPWTSPPGGPCLRCLRRRRAQHDTRAGLRAKVEDAYRRDEALGVYGHLPHHRRLAEALVRLMVANAVPGQVHLTHLLTMRSATQRLLPVHGCERCGGSGAWGTDGGVSRAVRSAAALRERTANA